MTKPNCEAIAVENLLQQGYGCYYPKYLALHKNKQVVKKPLFPRYVFALIDKFWYSIRGTRGVSHLLMGQDGPATVPNSVIDAIRAREDTQGFIVIGKNKSPERFNRGDPVRATDGPLTGLDLIYDGMAPHERANILHEMMGRWVRTEIDEKSLVAG